MKASTIQMLSSAGLSSSSLLIPNLARDQFGSTTAEIGVIVAGYSAAIFASSYIFGRFSDVYGRRRLLLAGLLLSVIAALLQIFADSGPAMLMVRVMVGLCAGIFPSALLAYVYETDKKVGKFSSIGALGFGFGVFIAGIIGIYDGIFLFSAVMMACAFLVALYLPFGKETHQHVPIFPVHLLKRNFPVYASIMFRHIGANMIWVIYPLFLADLGADAVFIGAIYAINAFGQFAFMMFTDRYKSVRLVTVGFIMSILTFPTYTLASDYWQIIPAQIMIALSWSTLYVGSIKYVMERSDEKGTCAGLLQSSLSISAIIGAILGGIAAELYGYHGCMYIATGMALIGLVIFLVTNRWLSRRDSKSLTCAGQ
ncbi:MAG: MFS transporter [Methanomassiliicoccales archaeon]|nr:MFS transporter [Methanomassiliicoccales archaeon]